MTPSSLLAPSMVPMPGRPRAAPSTTTPELVAFRRAAFRSRRTCAAYGPMPHRPNHFRHSVRKSLRPAALISAELMPSDGPEAEFFEELGETSGLVVRVEAAGVGENPSVAAAEEFALEADAGVGDA